MNARNADRLICDVILDQEVLPGVGNIIKNEALFDAGSADQYFMNFFFKQKKVMEH